jgi:hypothetical protein
LKHFFQDTSDKAVKKDIQPNLHYVTDLSHEQRKDLDIK